MRGEPRGAAIRPYVHVLACRADHECGVDHDAIPMVCRHVGAQLAACMMLLHVRWEVRWLHALAVWPCHDERWAPLTVDVASGWSAR